MATDKEKKYIGSRKKKVNGFTLIEVMLAASVLSLGTLVIFPAFMKAIDLLSVLEDRFPAEFVANNLLVEKEEKMRLSGDVGFTGKSEDVEMCGRRYETDFKCEAVGHSRRLYRATATVRWKTNRSSELSLSKWILK